MKLKSMLFKDQLYYNLLRFIHLLKGSWVDSCFWLLQIELPWHHVQGWYTHMLSFLMGKCLGLEGVIWQVYVNLFKKLPNYFPKYLHHSRSEKAMAPHSSTLAWEIPWTEEPGRLQSMGPLRVRHNWVTSLSLFTFMHWRRKWQPTPVFLPGESQGQESLVGFCLWGRTESDTTDAT